MDVTFLREFLVLADCLNFGTAARRLFVSQPTLSRHVQAVEDEAGCRLLERDRHSVSLTPAGEAAVAGFRGVVEAYESAFRSVREVGSSPEARLKVGIPPLYVRFPWAMWLGREVADTLPGLELSLSYVLGDDPCDLVLEGALDAALVACTFAAAREGLTHTPLGETRLCLIVPHCSTDGGGDEARRADVQALQGRALSLATRDRGLTAHLQSVLERAGVPRERIAARASVEDALNDVMMANGDEVCALGLDLGGAFAKALVCLPIDDPAFSAHVCLVTRSGDQREAIARVVECARHVDSRGRM